MFWIRIGAAVTFVGLVAAASEAQGPPTVTASFDTTTWVAAHQSIELRIDRSTQRPGARIAVLIGATDLTALFTASGDTLRYRSNLQPLPAGEQQLTVYTVSPEQEWTEVARFPIRVLTPSGYERADVLPRLTLSVKGQVAEGHSELAQAPPRAEYQDLVIATGLQTIHRRRTLSLRSQLNVLGASNRQEALRFRDLQASAPKLDLADYQVGLERGTASITLGENVFGQQRHLVNAFGSRGVGATARLGRATRLSLAALNGSAIVGWANPLGLSTPDHRVLGGALAFDVLPRAPGALTVEGTTMGGAVLPRAGINQGVINDAERSIGSGVRLTVADPRHRLDLDAGFSRSQSRVPDDPTLSQGLDLYGVTRTARNARYLDATLHALRAAPLTRSVAATLSVGFHHERVDPLYRTVAGAVRADVESDGVDVQAALGAVALHGTVRNLHDNLGHVASILTTRTRLRGGAVTLPLGSVFTRASWLPMLGYDIARTEQVGEGIPPNSEFTATHVPDQLSDNRNLSVQWQRAWWQIAYRLNLTHQDNRQSGRERADFTSAVHNLTLSLVGTRVNATVDLGMDGNDREESSEHSRTQRLGGTVDWHLTGSTTLTGGFTRTIVDHADTTVQRVSDGRVVIAQQLPLLRLSARSSPGQLFVRFSRQDETLGGGLAAALDRHTWYVSTGLTLGVF